VRFRDPGEIRRLLRDAIQRAIGTRPPDGARRFGRSPEGLAGSVRESAQGDVMLRGPATPGPAPDAAAPAPPLGEDDRPPVPFREHRMLGEVLGTYLLLERPGALVLLDFHAAHERVLFERMRESLLSGELERQTLLVPVWVELPRSRADALDQAKDALARAGFEVEVGETTASGAVRVGLRSVPAALVGTRHDDWGRMLSETAAELLEPGAVRSGVERALHDVLATAACHSAARKGDRLDPREAEALLDALDETLWVPNCPHGRPIALTLGEGELERRILRR
jgi:DNA mismatch repair protein MutL